MSRIPTDDDSFVYHISDSSGSADLCVDHTTVQPTIVWGLWRLKRSLGLRSGENLAIALFRQGIVRFSFRRQVHHSVLHHRLAEAKVFFEPQSLVENSVTTFQNVLSTLLICEFTIDLRRRNTKTLTTGQSAVTLPTLSFQENPAQSQSIRRTVLGRLHESIMTEMGESDDPMDIDNLTLNSVELDDPDDYEINSSA
ncbi:hypothetical protein Clacol_000340 [Clathrus columnatus]|uniref:Uncharacterized protein n=1 Tax=Clathrus columnatus TaxID=1419009 RepID=A0AAV4ZWE5_9AGAM|nr:hypothetical protein Clacol_000340 [Clathrus columnatus]